MLTRFRVADPARFAERRRRGAGGAARSGGLRLTADLARNVDEPDLWVLVTRWANVGSYRRALQGYESKMVVVPLLSQAIDEPSAYEDPELVEGDLAGGSRSRTASLDSRALPAGDGRRHYLGA